MLVFELICSIKISKSKGAITGTEPSTGYFKDTNKYQRNVNKYILDIKELQWQQEGKQGEDHPLGAYGGSRAEDNEVCYPCKLLKVPGKD